MIDHLGKIRTWISSSALLLFATICINSSRAAYVTFYVKGQLVDKPVSLCGQCLDRPDNITCKTSDIIKNQIACPVTKNINCVFAWWWETAGLEGNVSRDLRKDEFRLLDTREITANFSVYSQLHQYGYEGVIPGHQLVEFNLQSYSGGEGLVTVCGQCRCNHSLYHLWGDDCATWNRVPVMSKSAQVQIMLPSNCTSFQWMWAAVQVSPTGYTLKYELHGNQNRVFNLTACSGMVLTITDSWDDITKVHNQTCRISSIREPAAVGECDGSDQLLNSTTAGYTRWLVPLAPTTNKTQIIITAQSSISSTETMQSIESSVHKVYEGSTRSSPLSSMMVRYSSTFTLTPFASLCNNQSGVERTSSHLERNIAKSVTASPNGHAGPAQQMSLPVAHISLIAVGAAVALLVTVTIVFLIRRRKGSLGNSLNESESDIPLEERQLSIENMSVSKKETLIPTREPESVPNRRSQGNQDSGFADIADTANDLYEPSCTGEC